MFKKKWKDKLLKKSLSDKIKAQEHKSFQMWEYNPVENKIISLS